MSAVCGSGLEGFLGPAPTEEPLPRGVIVSGRVTRAQMYALDRIARREMVSRSQLIYEMIETYLERDELFGDWRARE